MLSIFAVHFRQVLVGITRTFPMILKTENFDRPKDWNYEHNSLQLPIKFAKDLFQTPLMCLYFVVLSLQFDMLGLHFQKYFYLSLVHLRSVR